MTQRPPVTGVVGLGAVGEALLRMLCASGHHVVGIDRDTEVLERVRRRTKTLEAGPAPTLTDDPAALDRAALVIEAVPDVNATKERVLRGLTGTCPDGTVLVTTTSALSVARLAIASGRPADLLALRFLAPPVPHCCVEQVRTSMTSPTAARTLDRLVADLGLRSARVGARPGADAVALVYGYLNRAVALCEQDYVGREDIDTAMRLGCGLPEGPLELLDRIGLDTAHTVLTDLHRRTGAADLRPAALLTDLVAAGRLGRKKGAGFHTYDDLGRTERAPAGADPDAAPPAPVRRVAVIGSGTMARGIAEVTAVAGLPTVLVARSRAKGEAALDTIGASLTRAVRRGRISVATRTAANGLLSCAEHLSAVGDRDLVIEAIAEDITAKRSLFGTLGPLCAPGTLLATATSSLSVTECAAACGRGGQVLGMHFFNPAPDMRLVELGRARDTTDETVARARAFCARLGKTAIVCPDRAGFIVNHLLFPYLGDAVRLLERHDTDIEEIDAAVEHGFGHPMGPFTLLDTIGLDIALAIQRRLHTAFGAPGYAPSRELELLVAAGRLGRKTGHGFRTAARRS
ncbi:3-hydroxyacyl-CoA dehydrogenase family protein [Streptantibioticus silvisoli]|uniref:3-hydroxyacyl-CoA dehydrogenase family protein n=1 Tax=Streptantibioticus silvisoli TaxID=2705255 RepID=A0ABT6WAW9_9ACTN|nr:3-hydroxyacyl-CoA dehydrogenase family protein [Streptantibioticus silvisoli]MDI5967631.1 3-hydroxyacyl-CoA dehydrogenase family protein [Streptantibioticus silvisoli]